MEHSGPYEVLGGFLEDNLIGPLSFREYIQATEGLARRLTRDAVAAEELYDQTLEVLWKKSALVPSSKPAAIRYVQKAVVHKFLDEHRLLRNKFDHVDIDNGRGIDIAAGGVSVASEALRFADQAALRAVIEQLSPAVHEIICRVYDIEKGDFGGQDRNQVAESLGVKRNTVDQAVSTGRALLRELLALYMDVEDLS